jgi:protocatechuate 3,4-dioxygenase alpha subunit
MSHVPTASQTVGPFFSIGLAPHYCAEIAADPAGQPISVRGRVLDGDGRPVPDAVLEVWSAVAGSADGASSEKGRELKYPRGFARVATNERGEFAFAGAKPAVRKHADGSTHAPHFVVGIFMRGLLRHLLTRLYFPFEPANNEDVVLRIVPANRRATIVGTRDSESGERVLWDIHLQGERETVFFET